MSKYSTYFFALIGLYCLGSPGLISAIDIETVFLKMNHKKFQESLRPFVYPEFYTEPGKSAKVNSAQVREIYHMYAKAGIVDLKNHYIYFDKDSATGGYKRTYVLYFSAEGHPIFVGSDRNSSSHDRYTDFFALCQGKTGQWTDCTYEIFPKLDFADLLISGAKLNKSLIQLLALYYELPRNGTKVQLKVIYDDYTYSNMEPNQITPMDKELKKFRKQRFSLVWDKENQKMVLAE